MPKFHVQAVARAGYPGSFRAQRFWPSNEATEVELLEQDDDPAPDPAKGVQIGKRTYEQLKADPNLVLRQPGDPLLNMQTAEQQTAELDRLRAENADLKSQLAAGRGESKHEGKSDEDDGRPSRRGR